MGKDKQITEPGDDMPLRVDEELQKEAPYEQADVLIEKEDTSHVSPEDAPIASEKPQGGRFKRFIHTKKGKVVLILAGLLVVVGVLLAVPVTRYGILGMVIKKKTPIVVLDSVTKKPVTEASISLGPLSAKTDGEGKVTLEDVPVGEYKLKVIKNYYTTVEVPLDVPVFEDVKEAKIDLVATGRQVSLVVTNTITKQPMEKAVISAGDTSAVTDSSGIATIVLPADKDELPGQVTLDGYNTAEVKIKITDQADANKINITPAGTVYFLSKQTGKINVMKSNLDGSAASAVVEGTGAENDRETALLAARDWRYLALSAKRKSTVSGQLYLVDTGNGSLKTIDEGNVDIQLVGWSDHSFLYVVTRNEKKIWEDKRQALKAYNADTGALTTIDETFAVGTNYGDTRYEIFGNPYIVEGKVVYAKYISTVGPTDRKSSIVAATPKDGQKQVLKEFSPSNRSMTIEAKLYEPQELYFRVDLEDGSPVTYFEYEAGTIKSVTNTDDKFYNTYYPTFLVSPDSQRTLWHEPRNGKNAIFIGDKNGKNSKELAINSEYATYGWFGDKYILLSKNGSELYITSADQQLGDTVKIADYHKPALNFAGYGYGYGGL